MNTDCELLELAAKAAGIFDSVDPIAVGPNGALLIRGNVWWDPLTDDGDAFRLQVKLGLRVVCVGLDHAEVDRGTDDSRITWQAVHNACDPYAATRRAITRAAAEIGRTM